MTTNNHPAHDPVSLDRLHQIREILSKASAQSDGGNLGYAMADAVKVIDGAIAAFGAEPVGYFYADKPGDWYQISDGDRVPEHRRIPLYSNPQSWQVVKLPNEFFSSEGIVVQIEKLMAVLAVHGIQYERRGNACRAAMLQGAEPVTTAYKLPELRYLDTVKFNADCALQDPESIYAQEFFMSLDEVFGERGNYTDPVQAKAVSILIAEIFRLRGYPAAPQQEDL